MDYAHLFAFVVFAEHRNFTHAARQLHISQPALHVQIRKLAEAVGRPLYARSGRELVLTREGERLAAYGRQVRDQGEHVLAELRGEHARGPVVLAAGQGAFLYLLGPAIRRFPRQRATPLRLLALPGPATIEAVRSARAHLGVVAADAPPIDLASTRLREVGQHVVVQAAHRLARRKAIAPGELAGEAIVVAPAGTPHRAMIEQALRVAAVRWSVAVEAGGWELQLHFARLGVGIAVVNDFCEPPRGMVAVPLRGVPAVGYWLIARDPLPEVARALHASIVETTRS